MINSINPNQSFGSTVTILEKVTDGSIREVSKTIIKNADTTKDNAAKKVLNGFMTEPGVRQVQESTIPFINETIGLLIKKEIKPDNNGIWLSKINENRFIYGNRDIAKDGLRVSIDFNV